MPPTQGSGPGAVVAALAGCCADAAVDLLQDVPVLPDRDGRQALDDVVDNLVDALRMIAAEAAELALILPTSGSPDPAARIDARSVR